MTISSESNKVRFEGNGSAASFDFDFLVFHKAHVVVVEATDEGVESVLTLDEDFTVTGAGDPAGGSITRLAGALPNGYVLSVKREVPLTQLTDLRNQGAFFADTHESAFDYLTMAVQQLAEKMERSVLLPATTELADITFPTPAAGKLLGWNEAGDGLTNLETNLADGAVTTAKLAAGAVTTAKLAASGVTYAKIQDVSAGKVLGRSTSGAGVVEEITCTAAGRALIDDANASAQRTTLGLGTAATANTGTSAGNVVVLDGSAKLPAVDGSQLTGLPGVSGNYDFIGSTALSGEYVDISLPTSSYNKFRVIINHAAFTGVVLGTVKIGFREAGGGPGLTHACTRVTESPYGVTAEDKSGTSSVDVFDDADNKVTGIIEVIVGDPLALGTNKITAFVTLTDEETMVRCCIVATATNAFALLRIAVQSGLSFALGTAEVFGIAD